MKVIKDGVVITNIEVTPKTTAIKLDIENRESKEFAIRTEVTGRPASGYVLLNKKITPETVKITGPASEIAKIDHVKAICDVSGIKASTTKKSAIVLYDVNGNEIVTDKFDIGIEEVSFELKVGVSKTVSVQCAGTEGKVADGYIFMGASPNVKEVTLVATDASLLDNVTDITIPSSAVNIAGLRENSSVSINLNAYVPTGVTFVANENINVNIFVEKRVSKQVYVSAAGIKVNNLKNGLSAVVSGEDAIKVTVSGTSANIAKVTSGNIAASVDLSNLSAGTHSVVLNLSTNVDCKIDGDYKVLVVITDNSVEGRTGQE